MTNDALTTPKPDLRPCIRNLLASMVIMAIRDACRNDPEAIEFCNSAMCQDIIIALGVPATMKMSDLLPLVMSGDVRLLIHQETTR